jgi:hypothetical protein
VSTTIGHPLPAIVNGFGALPPASFGLARTVDVAGHSGPYSHTIAHSIGPATDALGYWLRSAQTPAHRLAQRPRDLGCTAKLLLLSWSWRAVVRTLTSSLVCNLTYVLEELRARVDVTGQLPVVLYMKYFLHKKQYLTAAGGTAAVN